MHNLNIYTFEFILTDADNRHEKKENHQIARHVEFFVIVRYLLNCSRLMLHVAN